jgi:hypothetical protein
MLRPIESLGQVATLAMLLAAVSRHVTPYLQSCYVWQRLSHGQHGPISLFLGRRQLGGSNIAKLAIVGNVTFERKTAENTGKTSNIANIANFA